MQVLVFLSNYLDNSQKKDRMMTKSGLQLCTQTSGKLKQ